MTDATLDPQEILRRVREDILHKTQSGQYDQAEIERIRATTLPLPSGESYSLEAGEDEKRMFELSRLCDPWIIEPVPSHRKGLAGKIIRSLKQGYLKLLVPYHNELLRRQKAFNVAVVLYFQYHQANQVALIEMGRLLKALEDGQGTVKDHQEELERQFAQIREALKAYEAPFLLFTAREKMKDILTKGGLWFNDPLVVDLTPQGVPFVSLVTERIVEKAFVIRHLPDPPKRVLDLGCCESQLPLELASNGYSVVGIDFRPYSLSHPQFDFLRGDLCHLPLKKESFDVVCSLSTLEHIGIGHYGDAQGAEFSDRRGVEEIIRVLRSGGRFILTVPFGCPGANAVHRVYGNKTLSELLEGMRVLHQSFAVKEPAGWVQTDDEDQAQSQDSLREVQAVALIVSEKP